MLKGLWIQTQRDEARPMRVPPTIEFILTTVLLFNVVITVVAGELSRDNQGFAEFWSRFRTATLENDWKELEHLTSFPLTIRGELDRDPIRHASRSDFQKTFDRFLREGVFSSNEQFEIIRKTTTIEVSALCKDTCRIGDMIFKKTAKGWRLNTLYMQ